MRLTHFRKRKKKGSHFGNFFLELPKSRILPSELPLQEKLLQRRNSKENLDRFIPNRSSMDFDYAQYMLTGKENPSASSSPSREANRKQLAETFNMNRTRILAFKNKPPTPVGPIPNDFSSASHQVKSAKLRRHIPQTSEKTLDAPDLMDDYYLNLLDWASSNVLSIALGHTVYLWDASDGATSELVTIDEECGPVTSVKWAPDGCTVASAAGDETLRFWNVFGTPEVAKPAQKTSSEPFANLNRIR